MHIRLPLQVNSKAAWKVPPFWQTLWVMSLGVSKWPNICMLTASSIPHASSVILWKEKNSAIFRETIYSYLNMEAFTRNSKYISLLLQLTLSALPFGFM
uniref:Uncharacterized protein n=1 Tax=Nomascus leucogenys TaxID=61853 RepID=A0A2I3HFE5_NOMLE